MIRDALHTAFSSAEQVAASWEQKRWIRLVTLLSSLPMRIEGRSVVKEATLQRCSKNKDMVQSGVDQLRISLVEVLGHRSHHGKEGGGLLLAAQVADVLQHG